MITMTDPQGSPSGARIRARAALAALERVSTTTDVVVVRFRDPTGSTPPAAQSPSVLLDRRRLGRIGYAHWLLFGRVPASLARVLSQRVAIGPRLDEYDLVLFRPTAAHAAVGAGASQRVVVDVDDLDGLKDAHMRVARRRGSRSLGRRAVRRAFDGFASWRVRTEWDRYYRRLQDDGCTLIACSARDADHLGEPAHAPNGYSLPETPLGTPEADPRPVTLLFVGRLSYRPNQDAVDELVDSIWPAIRSAIPQARLIIVGAGAERWHQRAIPGGIEFTGEVDSLDPFLSRATATVLPIRSGGGTRLKVLEAFAHRIPVIAADVAVEGLDVTPGEHYLRADSVADFVAAVEHLVREPQHRVRLADASLSLVRERYSFEVSVDAFEEIFRRKLEQPPRCAPGASGGGGSKGRRR